VAETFLLELAKAMLDGFEGGKKTATEEMYDFLLSFLRFDIFQKLIVDGGMEMRGLNKIAQLDTTVTVDAFNIFANLNTSNFLSPRLGGGGAGSKFHRTTSSLLPTLKKLNLVARVLECSFGKIDARKLSILGGTTSKRQIQV